MTMHENMLRLSTAATATMEGQARPRRYRSAEHALGCYFLFVEQITGAPGLDPESLGVQVQSQPAHENPHMERIDDVRILAGAFEYAQRRALERHWRAWVLHRVERVALSKIGGVSKTTAHRYVQIVDSFVEAWLSERGLLAQDYRIEEQ